MTGIIDTGLGLLAAHESELELLGAASLVLLVASAALLPLLVARLPTDYFSATARSANRERHPLLRLGGSILRNLLGTVLLLAGIAMLVLPGQGLLTILAAVVVLDFPGKKALERRLVGYPPLLAAANRMRRWRGRPPFEM